MASDGYDSHRKHRQSSSPDEVDKSSKRHKHHRHHRHHRHRHESKKTNEENKHVSKDIESSPPSVDPIRPSMTGSSRPDDDVEEGEILDEECFGGSVVEIQENKVESRAGYTETEGVGIRDHSDKHYLEDGTDSGSPERKYRKSRTLGKDHNDDRFFSNFSLDKETKNQLNETGDESVSRVSSGFQVNGYLDYQSRIEYKMLKESGSHSGGSAERISYGEDDKANGVATRLSNVRNLSPARTRDKYITRMFSPSSHRSHAELPDRRRSRSVSYDHTRERSCSESVMEEEALLKRRCYYEKDGPDDETVVHHCDVVDSVREDDRDHSISYSTRYVVHEHMHRSREASDRETNSRDRSRERDVDRDQRREKERSRSWMREGSREREVERERRREKERARSREREAERELRREKHTRSRERELDKDQRRQKERARSREKERDIDYRREIKQERSRDRDFDRDRRRERARDSSRDIYQDTDKKRDRSRDRVKILDRSKDSEKERETERDRHSNRIMGQTRERRDDQGMGKERDKYEGHEDLHRHTHSRNLKHNVKDYSLDRTRDEHEKGDYEESASLHPDQEQDDLDRIKEESRRRRQAILEKYKKQQMQQGTEPKLQSEEAEKDKAPVVHSSQPAAISNAFLKVKNADDIFVAEPSLSVGKSPPPNGVAAFGAGGLGEGSPKSERSDDNFCDDIFGETPTGVRKYGKEDGSKIERSGLNDNWDDAEGYYSYRFGELLDGRYEITAAHGKGVFSTVVRAKNLKAANGEPDEVAVKIIRSNDTMYKAGMTELVILKKLAGQDPENKRHCVRFLSSFKYRNHLCLVFESLNMNLREVLKKFGRNIGLKLTAVRAYAKQLFIALKHLKNCGVLHCDIKPDNMLVNEAKNVLKLCDFGNAMFAGKNEITPYLVSRFYRAPEIILGLPYDHPLDIWSVGCCLYELYTGKVLFPGATNNDMIRLHMELKGPFPKKMLRKGAFIDQHFDHDLNFHSTEEDPVTKKAIKRLILNIKAKDIGSIITGSAGEDLKMLADFKDLLDKIFILDPDKRLTVSQALSHPFITVFGMGEVKGWYLSEVLITGGFFQWNVLFLLISSSASGQPLQSLDAYKGTEEKEYALEVEAAALT